MTDKKKKRKKKEKKVPEAFSIFPRASTMLITCTSNFGMTSFLQQALLNRNVFIKSGNKIWWIVYIYCNQRNPHFKNLWEDEEIDDDDDNDEEIDNNKEEKEEEE